ncbi:Asp-tRNAAsn/Glu-tRNAGln amidotransferase A subunit [Pseudonocardia ammonioxydans]|uniref:Asp-tRNAAsn/Glu-tRNAGln amidotransferase A subunit n=1 Tax=Pseudonocardia ammonioxydans TaxID=260086 RepID=A0A1I4UBR9_PSUAM|nr:amidase [Pseudonocardia ammonioxydans]SFM86427.1 Asp-tRNAAsn/Glu-tRNAGln amidotransferase A subunit [Pseudonocardia ammonioxydans]
MSAAYRPWPLRELVTGLTTAATTPAEALDRARRRITATDSELQAWVVPPGPELMPGPATGPLGGVPIGVKDIIDVTGSATRCGSALRAGAPPADADAAIVTAWREAGAIPVGKTVTTEFAYFSPGPTDNPAAPGHTPGGSSSGSAAAVAAGHVPLALGSQTAGSVTRPASFCGVAALVLGHGRLPVDGVTGLSPSLDNHGVFAASADDLALAFAALTGEPEAPRSSAPRLLFWDAGSAPLESRMQEVLHAVRDRLTAAGAAVEALPAPERVDELTAAHPVIMAAEAAVERSAELARSGELSVQLAELLHHGAGVTDTELRAARSVAEQGYRWLAGLLTEFDAVVGPAALGAPPAGLHATGDPLLSRPWQAAGMPALTVRGPNSPDGLPRGIQLVGLPRAESTLLATGRWVEAVLRDT